MTMNRKLLLSAAAIMAFAGVQDRVIHPSWAAGDDRMLSLRPGEVSRAPLPQYTDLAGLEPAAGEPVAPDLAVTPDPQVLGGADSDTDPIVPVSPAPVPVADAAVPPVMPPPVVNPAPMPDQALVPPTLPTTTPTPAELSPVTSTAMDPVNDVANQPVSLAKGATPKGPDTYYDSGLGVPQPGSIADQIGPRKVDPTLEPASKFIVAAKTHGAGDQEALLESARRALDLGRYESALDLYSQLYNKNKRDERILMGRAIAQQKLGQEDVAILSYEEVLEVAPTSTEAVVNLMGLLQKKYPEVALRRLADLQEKYPSNDMIVAQLGMAYANSGNYKDALRSLSSAASINPQNAQHLYNIAVVSDRAGNKTQAIKYYQDALQTDAMYGASRSVPRERIYDRLATLRQ